MLGSDHFSCCADLCSSGEPGGAPCPPSEYTDGNSDYQNCPALETGIDCTATGVSTLYSPSLTPLKLATPLNVYFNSLYLMSSHALSKDLALPQGCIFYGPSLTPCPSQTLHVFACPFGCHVPYMPHVAAHENTCATSILLAYMHLA